MAPVHMLLSFDVAKARGLLSSTTGISPLPPCPTRYKLITVGRSEETDPVAPEQPASPNATDLPTDPPKVHYAIARYIPGVSVSDILHYKPTDRAAHWMFRALVRNTTTKTLQHEMFEYYLSAFAPHKDTHPTLGIAEFVDLLLKLFKGSAVETLEDGHTHVINNVEWREWPQGKEMHEMAQQGKASSSETDMETLAQGAPNGSDSYQMRRLWKRQKQGPAKFAFVAAGWKAPGKLFNAHDSDEVLVTRWANWTFIPSMHQAVDCDDIRDQFLADFASQGDRLPAGDPVKTVIQLMRSAIPAPTTGGSVPVYVENVRWRTVEEWKRCLTEMAWPEAARNAVHIDDVPNGAHTFDEPVVRPETEDFMDYLNDFMLEYAEYTIAEKFAGRKLSHLPEPWRTRLWLRMYFEHGDNTEITKASLWAFYKETFKPYYGTSPHLDDAQLVEQICKVFENAEEVEVAPELQVIWSVKPREKHRKASILLRQHARAEKSRTEKLLARMTARGDFGRKTKTKTKKQQQQQQPNKFQAALLKDPLLSLPAGTLSPWMQRLRRRANGEPLGGEQPGFPGVSMTRLNREYKREIEAAKQVNENAKKPRASKAEPASAEGEAACTCGGAAAAWGEVPPPETTVRDVAVRGAQLDVVIRRRPPIAKEEKVESTSSEVKPRRGSC